MSSIGKRIKEARKLHRFSREQVARKIGVSQQQVSRYESGENDIAAKKLFMIAIILHQPIEYFFETYSEL